MKKRLLLIGFLIVLPAVSGAEDQKGKDDKSGGTDTTVVGTVNSAVIEATRKQVEAINRANKAQQEEWNARRQVDEKKNFEQAQKVAEKQQALDAANSHVQQDAQTLSQRKADVYNADGKRAAAEWKESQTKSAYENAQRQADAARQNAAKQNGGTDAAKQEAAKLQEQANKLKTDYDDAAKAAAKAREDLGKAQQAQTEARNKLQSSEKAATQANQDLETAKMKQKSVAEHSTTKEGPPKTKTSKIEKATTAINVVQTASGFGSAVKGVKDAWESGDEAAKRGAGVAAVETLAGAALTTPAGTAAAAAYGTAKTVVAATDEAANAVRAGKESGDAAKDAQAMAIARDLFEASRKDSANGEKPLTAAEAQHIAEGYVYGMGDGKSRQAVEDLYKSGVLKDENGNAKSIPQAAKAGGFSDLTATDVIKNSANGLVDVGAAVVKGIADGADAAVEIGKEYADGITDVEVLKEAARQAAEGAKDDASAVGSVLSGEATGEFFKDRVEAVEETARSVKDAVVETYGKLTGKETVEDQMKSGERNLAYKLVEMGMEPGKAAATARDLYSGEDGKMAAAAAAIREQRNQAKAGDLRDAEAPNEDTTGGEGKSVAESPATWNFFTDWLGEHQEDLAAFTGLSSILMGEAAQEVQNVLTKAAAQSTLDAGGGAARATLDESAAETAAAQDATSWGSALANGLQQGVETGAASFGESFGGTLGDRAANSVFGDPNHKEKHVEDDLQPHGGGTSVASGGGSVPNSGDSGHAITVTQVADANGNPVGEGTTASTKKDSSSSGKKASSSGKKASSSGKKASSKSTKEAASTKTETKSQSNTTGLKCVFCGEMKALKWMPRDDGYSCSDCWGKYVCPLPKGGGTVSVTTAKPNRPKFSCLRGGCNGMFREVSYAENYKGEKPVYRCSDCKFTIMPSNPFFKDIVQQ